MLTSTPSLVPWTRLSTRFEKAKNSGKAFIDAPGDPQVKTCIEKVQALDDALNKAGTWVATLTEE